MACQQYFSATCFSLLLFTGLGIIPANADNLPDGEVQATQQQAQVLLDLLQDLHKRSAALQQRRQKMTTGLSQMPPPPEPVVADEKAGAPEKDLRDNLVKGKKYRQDIERQNRLLASQLKHLREQLQELQSELGEILQIQTGALEALGAHFGKTKKPDTSH